MAKKTNHYVSLSEAMGLGIDISKASLELCWLVAEGEHRHQIENCARAISELADALVAAGYTGKIILESTSYYHWLAVVMLSEKGLDVRLINPLLASKHHKGGIRKKKTDPVDAFNLATMALTERRLPARWRGDAQWVQRRHQVGLIRTVERSLQQLQAALSSHREALAMTGLLDDPIVAAFEEKIGDLKRTQQAVQRRLSRDFAALHEANQARYASIPGVSAYLSGLMNLLLRTDVSRAKSWIAFVGLDLSVKQSGTWKGHSKLTKRGMGYLRKKLYQAAWGAKQNDADFHAYYQTLRDEGRPYKEVLLMIARKLLRIAFVLQQRQENYRPEIAWA